MPVSSRPTLSVRSLSIVRRTLLTCCFLTVSSFVHDELFAQSPELHIDYWINKHVQAVEGEKYDIAQRVFKNVMRVADNPAGDVFSLYIFVDLGLTQVFALPDGSIVLPLEVIDFCLRDRRTGEARLAFLLGHEIKHLIRRDYWVLDHIRGFFVHTEQQNMEPNLAHLMEEVQWNFQSKYRKAVEAEADRFGILYASLAGYSTEPIIDFIPEYYRSAKIDVYGDVTNNSANERIRAVRGRLEDAIKHLPLFDLGVMLYAIGQHDPAIQCLSRFTQQYPSREVFNNLGLCYYQKALSLYAKWKPEDTHTNPNFVFKLSPQVDPVSRIRGIRERAFEFDYEQPLALALDLCLENLEKAKELDPEYEAGYNNSGCAHLLKGEIDFAKGNFKKAIELNPFYQEAYNNLGVCYASEGNGEAAQNSFFDALKISSTYLAPVFNLGQLHRSAGRIEEAAEHFQKYLELGGSGKYADMARDYLGVKTTPIQPPGLDEVILKRPTHAHSDIEWTHISTPKADIEVHIDPEQQVQYFDYRSRQEELRISIVKVGEKYKGQTRNRIRIGDPDQQVKQRYPYPRREIASTRGRFWVFDNMNLVFQIWNGKVRSWYLFEIL